jgi:tight adherence protein B
MTRAAAVVPAAAAAVLAVAGAHPWIGAPLARAAARAAALARRAGGGVDEVLAPLRRAGAEGRDATRRERRRLRVAFAAASLPLAWLLADPLAAMAAAVAAALLAPRALVWRRERYVRRLNDGAGAAATALADALAAGHSARAALAIAARGLDGPIGAELRRTAADLELGAATDDALEALRRRAASRRIDLLVAAIRLQRRAGGNLAALLRDVAGALEDQARVEAEARAETAQARFTSTVVLAMPLCVVALGEAASPGMAGRIAGSGAGLSLLAAAAVLQVLGATLVRRLARVEA